MVRLELIPSVGEVIQVAKETRGNKDVINSGISILSKPRKIIRESAYLTGIDEFQLGSRVLKVVNDSALDSSDSSAADFTIKMQVEIACKNKVSGVGD